MLSFSFGENLIEPKKLPRGANLEGNTITLPETMVLQRRLDDSEKYFYTIDYYRLADGSALMHHVSGKFNPETGVPVEAGREDYVLISYKSFTELLTGPEGSWNFTLIARDLQDVQSVLPIFLRRAHADIPLEALRSGNFERAVFTLFVKPQGQQFTLMYKPDGAFIPAHPWQG